MGGGVEGVLLYAGCVAMMFQYEGVFSIWGWGYSVFFFL